MRRTLALFGLLALTAVIGCMGEKPPTPGGETQTSNEGKKEADDHSHGTGPHGGVVADWGGGRYHVEFTVSHPKKETRVYVLDSNAKRAAPIKAKDGQLVANVKGVKDKDRFEVILKAEPQKGDPEGTASCFVGTHEKLGVEQEFEGTILGTVGGKNYVGDFKEEP